MKENFLSSCPDCKSVREGERKREGDSPRGSVVIKRLSFEKRERKAVWLILQGRKGRTSPCHRHRGCRGWGTSCGSRAEGLGWDGWGWGAQLCCLPPLLSCGRRALGQTHTNFLSPFTLGPGVGGDWGGEVQRGRVFVPRMGTQGTNAALGGFLPSDAGRLPI